LGASVIEDGESSANLDIRQRDRRNPRSEFFVMYMGDEQNTILVLTKDKKYAQLVLLVHENARYFERELSQEEVRLYREGGPGAVGDSVKNVFSTDGILHGRFRTPQNTRYFLIGCDERRLFMCRLPGAVTSVPKAHACLRPGEIAASDRRKGAPAYRQGEWFLRIANSEEMERIVQFLARKAAFIEQRAPINTRMRSTGKPHTAEELLVVPSDGVYVRGYVRHADHKTLRLHS